MRVVSIDPGLRQCGVAIWDCEHLVWAGLARNDYSGKNQFIAARSMSYAVWALVATTPQQLVIERPQVIRGWTRNAESITALSLVVGALLVGGGVGTLAPALPQLFEYLPVQQKGNVPKPIMESRARARLSQAELLSVHLPYHNGKLSKSLAHNVWDAVWLGLQHIGRK